MSDTPDLTDRQTEVLGHLPASKETIADHLGIAPTTVEGHLDRIRNKGVDVAYDRDANQWRCVNRPNTVPDTTTDSDENTDSDPDPDNLTDRERYLLQKLQTGATLDELSEDLDEPEPVIRKQFETIKARGWTVYHDDEADLYEVAEDTPLRSSEHKGTRTRKANKWWETRHNAIERERKKAPPTDVNLAYTPDAEDWVTHLTDLHAGDRERDYDNDIVYSTEEIPDVVEYVTHQSISLSEHHGAEYDTAHLLWGGDMVTNEGIYEGQFEDLDAWLDEQADTVYDALLEQVITFADHFDTVNVVCKTGNHGEMRASGTSKQANADLLIYKNIQTFFRKAQQHHDLYENVQFSVGQARSFIPVPLRGGKLHGHLRHGQHRKPQAETSARLKEWLATLIDAITSSWGAFDVAWMGHHHVSGRIPWNGPPIFVTGSPKPAGEYIEELGTRGPGEVANKDIAHCHGISDEGVTGVYPIDDRHYDR
jgi:DNA-binding CsgD family transcriptional regulator